jgi:gas vesicle protein
MARDYYEPNYGNSTFGIFAGVLAGAIVGATALFLADEKNRKKIQKTAKDWKEKADDEIENLESKANKLKKKGLERVTRELDKTSRNHKYIT